MDEPPRSGRGCDAPAPARRTAHPGRWCRRRSTVPPSLAAGRSRASPELPRGKKLSAAARACGRVRGLPTGAGPRTRARSRSGCGGAGWPSADSGASAVRPSRASRRPQPSGQCQRRACGHAAGTAGDDDDTFGRGRGWSPDLGGVDLVDGDQARAVGPQGHLDTAAAGEEFGRDPFGIEV